MQLYGPFCILLLLISCSDSKISNENEESGRVEIINDTLYYTETMSPRFRITYDTLTADKLVPRNIWVTGIVEGKEGMAQFMNHCQLYIESDLPDKLEIRKVSENTFKFFIHSDYKGFFPAHGGEYMTLFPSLAPNKGIVFDTYFLDTPITYPERTRVMMLYEPIQENNVEN